MKNLFVLAAIVTCLFLSISCNKKDNPVSHNSTDTLYIADGNSFWTKLNGPYNASITCIKCDKNNYIYVGTYQNGLFISKDMGKTWSKTNFGDNVILVDDINILYDGTIFVSSDAGYFESTNYGVTWTKLNPQFPAGIYYPKLYCLENGLYYVYDPKYINGATMTYIYFSKDKGTSWTKAPIDLKGSGGIIGNNGLILLISLVDSNSTKHIINIFSSSDFGKSFNPIYTSTDIFDGGVSYNFALNSKNEILIYVPMKGIIRSNDMGKSFESISDSMYYFQLGFLKINNQDNMLLVTTSAGVYFSNNSGTLWQNILPFDIPAVYYFTNNNYIIKNVNSVLYISKNPIN